MTRPLAVYVHIPFCTVKCGYCDFNAYAGLSHLKDDYAAAMVREVELDASLFDGYEVTSIGFGGGTPGEIDPGAIAAVIAAVRSLGSCSANLEVSLEANPGSTSGADLERLAKAGVNRISFGAQSFHADELRFLDRIHSPEAIGAAVALARGAGVPSVGLDLIYGLPGQSPARWEGSLDAALALNPDHISCYALTVEEGTPLGLHVDRGEVTMPGPDSVADLYDVAAGRLAAAGFEQYELSNWAKPGHQSLHNRTYWTDGDYLQIGAGAHGYLSGERFENIAHPRSYIEAVTEGSAPNPALADRYRPDVCTAMGDWLTARLRLLEGFAAQEFSQRFGVPLEEVVGPIIERCRAAGVLEADDPIRLTARGRLLHGEVAAELVAHLKRDA
jgi:oxygen-independent coproporphyrinogen-3 oxidase